MGFVDWQALPSGACWPFLLGCSSSKTKWSLKRAHQSLLPSLPKLRSRLLLRRPQIQPKSRWDS